MFEWLQRLILRLRDPEHARRVDLLARNPLFEGLPHVTIGRLLPRMFEKAYAPGDVVFRAGDPGRGLFVVLDGEVEILRSGPDDEPGERMALFGSNTAFGELALIDEHPRSATARVVKPTRMLILYRADFDAIMTGDPRVALEESSPRCRPVREKRGGATNGQASRFVGDVVTTGHATRLPALPRWFWWLAIAATAAVAYAGRGLLLPLLAGLGGAYFINPLVRRLEERAISRSDAVTLVVGGILGLGALVINVSLPAIQTHLGRAIADAPAHAAQVEAALDRAAGEVRVAWPLVGRFLPDHLEPGWLARGVAASFSGGALTDQLGVVLSLLVLAPMFAFFFLRDGPRTVDWVIGRVHPRHIETSVAAWAQMDVIIGRYLRGLALECVAVGLLSGVGLWVIGVPFAPALGLLAAVVNPVPYVGVLFSLTVAMVVALTSGMSVGSLASVFGLFVLVRLIDDVVIVPLTIGGSVHLHPLLVIVSIVIGEHAMGVLGMVLAVPAVTVVKEVARLLFEHQRTLSRGAAAWLAIEEDSHIPL